MSCNSVDDVGLNATTADMAEKEVAVSAMFFCDLLGQLVPAQSLLARWKLPTLMHMVVFCESPFLELLLELR